MTQDATPGNGYVEPGRDEWGVPYLIFGPHPEEFWGGMGRVASLTALLEDRLLALVATLKGQEFGASPLRMDDLLTELERQQRARAHVDPWTEFGTYLARARRCVTYRNDLIHSVWPAQPGGRIFFGHRLRTVPRAERTAGGPVAERRLVMTNLDELRSVVSDLVALTERDFLRWYSLANSPTPA